MGQIVLGVLANVLRVYGISRLLRQFCSPKDGHTILRQMACLGFVALTSGGYYLLHSPFVNLCTNLAGFGLLLSRYEGGIWQKCFMSLGIYSLNVLTEGVVFASLVGFYGSRRDSYESFCECITSVGILLLAIILERTKAVKQEAVCVKPGIWLALIGTPLVSMGSMLALLERELSGRNITEMEIASILIVNLSVFYLFGAIQEYYRDREEKNAFRQQMERYSYELDLLRESHGNIQKLRHDMKHHITEMRCLAKVQSKEALLVYLDEMQKLLVSDAEYASSGNKDIDGTLNYLLCQAKELLDKVEVDIAIPRDLELHSYQVNVILGNLLENAVYAAKRSEKRYVGIMVKVDRNLLFLSIKNSYTGTIQVQGKRLLSTKTECGGHGIGLESVKKILDEGNGTLDIKWDGEMFQADVMMYL